MKKKILSTLLMSAMVLSIAACGGNTETPEATTNGTEATTTMAEKEESAEEATTTTAPETEETTTTTEAPVELPEITDYSLFMESCLAFRADEKNYVLNLVDKKMYEYESEGLGKLCAVKGKVALFEDNVLLNLETGEIIASKETNGTTVPVDFNYLAEFWYNTDYIPVVKTEESFEGNVYSFGVLDETAEWILPLSSDYEICKKKDLSRVSVYCGTGSIMDVDKLNYDIALRYYDFKNNKFIEPSNLNGDNYPWAFSGDNILIAEYGEFDYYNISKYNTVIGDFTLITEDKGAASSSGTTQKITGGIALWTWKDSREDGTIRILDENFNDYGFDLSKYEINYRRLEDIYACDERIAFWAPNSDGDEYTIILNKDGSYAVDPIKGECIGESVFYGDYVVCNKIYYSADGSSVMTDYIANCSTGEVKAFLEDNYDILGADSVTGKMLVSTNGNIYLADISDPDTLINPFEY